ncbi:hypothetical protein HC928_09925 [bacterium]|nr:hypothetical protein [bacterium]
MLLVPGSVYEVRLLLTDSTGAEVVTRSADDFNLRDDWRSRENRLRLYGVRDNLKSDDFLQVVALLTTYE